MTGERVGHRRQAAAPDERHHDIDRIRGLDLGVDLIADSRLAGRIRQQRRVEQWNEWLLGPVHRSIRTPRVDGPKHPAGLHRKLSDRPCPRQAGYQISKEASRYLHSDSDPIALWYGVHRSFDLPGQMQSDAVRGISWSQRCVVNEALVEVAQQYGERLVDQNLVQTGS
jgi:hypothetical protein